MEINNNSACSVKMIFLFGFAYVFVTVAIGTPLDDYVNRPDPTYKYTILDELKGVSYTLYTLNMTSQTWKPELQSRPIWWHYMTVIIPDRIERDSGFLFIDGGSNTDSPPGQADEFVIIAALMAISTRSVAACLKQIPNQPIVFKDDPSGKPRSEDSLIAWTWKSFIKNNGSDPEILLRMPMTKAAVRALDTVQDLTLKLTNHTVSRFMVAGASKRGWATWTTGAVDKRVVSIVPVVLDLLNLVKNLHHHYRSLGGWTFVFSPYYDTNFTKNLDNQATQKMAQIIDPLAYNQRYANKPKLIMSATGDEFLLLDGAKFYYDQLFGDKYLRFFSKQTIRCFPIQVGNHLNGDEQGYKPTSTRNGPVHEILIHQSEGAVSTEPLLSAHTKGESLPKMKWTIENNKFAEVPKYAKMQFHMMTLLVVLGKIAWTSYGGKITLMTETTPLTVMVYHATTLSDKRKDFRLFIGSARNPRKRQLNPIIWFSKPAIARGNNTYVAECTTPFRGWTAFFIQVTFPGLEDSIHEFTTETHIIPDTYPFLDCFGETCRGTLV